MPDNHISMPFARVSGSAVATNVVGTNATAVGFDQAILSTMWCAPIRIPADFDPTHDANVYADLQAVADNATAALVAILRADATICPQNGAWLDWDAECEFSVPNPWSILDTTRILFDNGGGQTFPAGTIEPGAMLGMRMRRLPGDARDNYAQTVRALASLTLVYHRRCQWGGCF